MMPTSPANGVVSAMPAPLQTPLMTVALSSTTLHGSLGVPAPLYLKPLEPAGLPSAFQPLAGRLYVSSPALVDVSRMRSEPPEVSGSPEGNANVSPVAGLLTN